MFTFLQIKLHLLKQLKLNNILKWGLIPLLISCSSLFIPKLDSDINYQRDVKVKVSYWDGEDYVGEESFDGIGVVKKAQKYRIKIYPPGKADMITFTSCHREHKFAKPKKGWLKSYHEFEIEPVVDIETNRICGIDVGIYEKEKGRHGWASFAINSNRRVLSTHVKCNGRDYESSGVTFCQAKKGLIQSVEFDRQVIHTQVSGCMIQPSKNNKHFEYLMPEGDCAIIFYDVNDEALSHKLILFGYDTIPIRGVQ